MLFRSPYQLSQRELGTSLTAADLRRLLPAIVAAEPALNECWVVDDDARTLAVHGLQLHGSIQFIHYSWEGKLYLTVEYRQGDQAQAMRLIEERRPTFSRFSSRICSSRAASQVTSKASAG